MSKVVVKYGGLHKRDNYEGLIDYLDNKQEKLKYPDREAKFVRESPQYQQLLSNGFVEVEKQQLNQLKKEQEEHAVIRTAHETNESAKEVKVVASQTDKPIKPITKSSASQSDKQSVGYAETQTSKPSLVSTSSQSDAGPMIFDMTVGDRMDKFRSDIQDVEDAHERDKSDKEARFSSTLQPHLGDTASEGSTLGFVKKLANKAVSFIETTRGPAQPPRSLVFGDGRGKTDFYTLAEEPMSRASLDYKPKSSDSIPMVDTAPKSPPKAKGRPKKTLTIPEMTAEDKEVFDEILRNATKPKAKPKSKTMPPETTSADEKPKPKPVGRPKATEPEMTPEERKPKPKPKAKSMSSSSSSSAYVDPGVKKTITKEKVEPATTGTRIPPSVIGIQKLREELENAKNKKLLSTADVSLYMQLYDDWKDAKGNAKLKAEKLKELRALYKRVLYKQ